ncbi:GroES-like protein [Gymnopus androsaceus JB14]|uniref:GroES-like protein n=1 Tax=Gymnopus androsaceus JB14 TaxID=1447944 RepID=A0A6A4GQV5_9AGAR|nr:GroES-like protein [Gymnopus androsaceus JB14]
MAAIEIPNNIKAIQVQADRTVKLVEIPFGQQDLVKNIPEDQVIVHVRAVGLNPTDWKHGLWAWGTPGTILGCDCAGDVVRVGSAVKHLKVGNRVAGFNYGGSYQTDNGSYAEYVRLYAAATFKIPDEMSYEEGAALPIAHLTAPFSQPSGEKEIILIWGGSTAVGHNAIQLAKISNLRVFVTASTTVHDDLKALGAEKCFDYKAPDVVEQIRAAAGERGIIYGLDTVSANGTIELCTDAMSSTRRSHLMVIVFPSKESLERRKDVKVELCVVYTLLGFDFKFANTIPFPAIPSDKVRVLEYVKDYMPRVLEGWQSGKGSSTLKPMRLRRLGTGLDKIDQGLKIMMDGEYGREKLVCTIY